MLQMDSIRIIQTIQLVANYMWLASSRSDNSHSQKSLLILANSGLNMRLFDLCNEQGA